MAFAFFLKNKDYIETPSGTFDYILRIKLEESVKFWQIDFHVTPKFKYAVKKTYKGYFNRLKLILYAKKSIIMFRKSFRIFECTTVDFSMKALHFIVKVSLLTSTQALFA